MSSNKIQNNNNFNKVIFPSCQKCDGLLNFEIQPLNFSINYKCEKDEQHKKDDIYYKVFERFYLKEKELRKCYKCQINLENSEYFHCALCKNIYCSKCYIEDIQKNGHTNLITDKNNNRCLIHNCEFTIYCFTCRKSECIFCAKNDGHKDHLIKSFYQIIPSLKDIEDLKNRVLEKANFTNNLIKKIDFWQQKINSKAEELKQNLKDEINLIEKFILNFNNTFMNYTYFQNFDYINKNVESKSNNQNLIKFFNCENFEKQTEILIEVFKLMGKKKLKEKKPTKVKGQICTINNNINYKIVLKTFDQYFIYHDYSNIYFSFYDNSNKKIINVECITSNSDLYSISISSIKDKNKLFICFLNSKKILIIDYNYNNGKFKTTKKEINNNIIFNSEQHFYKCIQLNNKNIAASDNNQIIIWTENEYNYIQNNIQIFSKSIDLLLIDDGNFISSQPNEKTLTIYDANNYEQVKIIKNIDCINNVNCFFKLNEKYIIINCNNGIAILSIKTKDIIQYVENINTSFQKICCDNKENIYILNNGENKNVNNNNFNSLFSSSLNLTYKIQIAKIIDGSFKLIKEYDEFFLNENNIEITFLDERYLFLWRNNGYIYNITD